jgi:hypothetical protein
VKQTPSTPTRTYHEEETKLMRKKLLVAIGCCLAATLAGGASAQSPDYMTEDCRLASQQFYQEFEARSEASYEGQRTDGTHAVNGTIYLENRSAYFSCSYNSKGDTLVEFFAENQGWPEFVAGGGSPYQTGGSGGSSSTVDVGGVSVPQAALDSCVSDAASAMSVGGQNIRVVKAGQEGSDTYYIEVASGDRHLVCSVNSKGEILDTRYGRL